MLKNGIISYLYSLGNFSKYIYGVFIKYFMLDKATARFKSRKNILTVAVTWFESGSLPFHAFSYVISLATTLPPYRLPRKYLSFSTCTYRYMYMYTPYYCMYTVFRLNSGIFCNFEPREWNLNLNSSDCRASKIIFNIT